MLEVRGLGVRYGAASPALEDIRPDGSRPGNASRCSAPTAPGKTSLFHALSGLIRSTGEVLFEGRSLQHMRPASIVALGSPSARRAASCLRTCRSKRTSVWAPT